MGEAGTSVEHVRVYVVLEMKETGDDFMVPAFKEERKGTQYLDPLGSQHLESYVPMSSIPTEESYVTLWFSQQGLLRMPSSGMLHHVALVITEVSEEHITSIIRVTRIGMLETLEVTSNQRTL
jgi:hypothetical protein